MASPVTHRSTAAPAGLDPGLPEMSPAGVRAGRAHLVELGERPAAWFDRWL